MLSKLSIQFKDNLQHRSLHCTLDILHASTFLHNHPISALVSSSVNPSPVISPDHQLPDQNLSPS